MAVEKNEFQKLGAVIGALLLGHESCHQRADQLSAARGVKAQRSGRVATADADMPSSSYGHLVGDSAGPAVRADSKAGGRRRPASLGLELRHEPGGGRDDRRRPGVDGVDDLRAVDALQIDRGDPEVGVPELALDDDKRHALERPLDSVGATQSMGREPPRTVAAGRSFGIHVDDRASQGATRQTS
jgi:hypothetical protein